MEIVGVAFIFGFLMWRVDRQERAELFPPQPCGYCPMSIHFDHGDRRWIHDNGKQYLPLPRVASMDHPALPGTRAP